MKTIHIYNLQDGEYLREATPEEEEKYLASLNPRELACEESGGRPGEEYGFPGITIYMI